MKFAYKSTLFSLVVLVPLLVTTIVHAQSNSQSNSQSSSQSSANSRTQQADEVARSSLTIGTKVAPPFAMTNEQGQWHGISIDLINAIAKKLQVDIEFAEHSLSELITEVQSGKLDASIAAISITPELSLIHISEPTRPY